MRIGAQLYTVRAFTQTDQDLNETIKKLATIGYDYVQVSGIGPISVQTVADICDDHDIRIIITHTDPSRIKDDTEAVIEEHDLMEADYIGIGAMPSNYERTREGVQRFITDFTPAAEKIAASGMKLMYHNHNFEFEKYYDKRMIEYLRDEFPLIGFTLDTYWVQAAGADPTEWLTRLSGRVDVVHLKDMTYKQGEVRMSEVMEGNLNWRLIIPACKMAGVKYAMVEQDECYGEDPFECLSTSLENIKEML